jgi:hypothetical protein
LRISHWKKLLLFLSLRGLPPSINPAMAAGIAQAIMKMADVVALIDAANPVPAPYNKRDAAEISN